MSMDIQAQHAERELPSPSGVAQRVLGLLRNDNTTLSALVQALGADPAMAGRVLRLANSAVYGVRTPVVILADAVQRIGLNSLKQVLVGFSLVDRYRRGHCANFDYPRFWAQSLATAVAARHLGTVAGLPAPGECFTLGLLTRSGELALATLHPDDYGPLHQALSGCSAEQISARERANYTADRYILAEHLLREWQLPDSMAVAVRGSGEPAVSGLMPQGVPMRLARILQISVQLGSLFDPVESLPPIESLKKLRRMCDTADISIDELNVRLPEMLTEWRDWSQVFALDIRGGVPLSLDLPVPAEIIPFPGALQQAVQQDPDHRETPWPEHIASIVPAESQAVGQAVPTEHAPTVHPAAAPALIGARPPESVQTVARRDAAPEVEVSLGLRILVAHPDPAAIESWITLMLSQQHRLRLVDSAQNALAELLREPPQVVICDLGLRDLDVLGLCRSIRASRPGRELYLMVTGARERPGALESAFGAGADDFLATPVQAGELISRLRAARRFIDMQEQLIADQMEVRRLATELAMANTRLEHAADTDPLTGIANRRRANEHLIEAVRQAEEQGQPLGVFLVDLDHFKRINDTWGHATGDEVLRQAARALQAYSRTSDLVSRFGGEEFLVIAPGTTAPAAAALAERLRAGIALLRIAAGQDQIAVTFSVGVSVYDPLASARKRTPEALLHMADEALYRAKDSGRNRVCVAADRPAPKRPEPPTP